MKNAAPIVVTAVLALAIAAIVASSGASVARTAKPATWNIFVPRGCETQALAWTKGRTRLDELPVQDFLKLKTEIEGCGGRVALAK